MNKIPIIFMVIFLICTTAHADLLCIKRKNPVKGGKVVLKNALVVKTTSCPKGYNLLADTDSFFDDGLVTNATLAGGAVTSEKIEDGAVTSDKLAAGIITKSFSINPTGAALFGGATVTTGFDHFSGIDLPNTGTPNFMIGFTLPSNYTPGGAVRVYLLALVDQASCAVSLRPNSIAVLREGVGPIHGAGTADGLSVEGGTTISFPATSKAGVKIQVNVTAPDGTQLLPGDSVIFNLFRASGLISDTCTVSLKIQGIEVQYE